MTCSVAAPEYRTATIGRYAEGQFLASVTYAFPEGFSLEEGREDKKRLYTVLHQFDSQARHIHSNIWCAGTWAEQQRHPHGNDSALVWAKAGLAQLLHSLPQLRDGDIAIRPFQLTVDGVLFGLVSERHAEGAGEDDWAELYPDGLESSAPWDGQYDT
ncbi:hypothetical protein [Streptomyces sp. Tue6028]|uniref:hypothetical protein n=1 Tax=Streptomyces sp. Tue6028 TaxID=2036037 RepID=UPI003EBCEA3C